MGRIDLANNFAITPLQSHPSEIRRSEGGVIPVYYEAAAVITVLVLLGQVLELRARERTGSAIRALLKLAPKTARRIRDNGDDEEVALEMVHLGDRLRVRPGDSLPVDGVVLDGKSAVDESMVTGESMPVEKEPGAKVIGGTINGTGGLVMRAEKVGSDTMLARIVHMVGEAQRSRAPIQRLADAVAAWFVPAVILAAVVAFVAWMIWGPPPAFAYALVAAVSVVIIACPCALGLATPMSIMVGVGKGATAGVLIKNAEALERFEKIDTLVIDKTGTLTEGKPRVVAIIPAEGFDEATVLSLGASLSDRASTLSRRRSSPRPSSAAWRCRILPTLHRSPARASLDGVGGRQAAVGNSKLFSQLGIASTDLELRAEQLRRDGATAMFVAIDGRPAGHHRGRRPDQGDDSGSPRPRCERTEFASSCSPATIVQPHRPSPGNFGITDIEAEVLPEQKNAIVRRLRAKAARSPWPATASTTPLRSPKPMSASRWAPVRTSPCKVRA